MHDTDRKIGRKKAAARYLSAHYPCAAMALRAMQWFVSRHDMADECLGDGMVETLRTLPFRPYPWERLENESREVRKEYGRLLRHYMPEVVAYERAKRRLERRGMLSRPESWPCSWPGLYWFRGATNRERFADVIAQQMGETFERVALAMATYA